MAGVTSFDLTGGDPASEAYSVLVTYADGSSQFGNPWRNTILDENAFVIVDGTRYNCKDAVSLMVNFCKKHNVDTNKGMAALDHIFREAGADRNISSQRVLEICRQHGIPV